METVEQRVEELEKQVEETNRKVSEIMSAFVNQDTDAHRRYHEIQLEMLEEKRRLRIAIQEKTISGLIWSVIVFIAMAALQYLKQMK